MGTLIRLNLANKTVNTMLETSHSRSQIRSAYMHEYLGRLIYATLHHHLQYADSQLSDFSRACPAKTLPFLPFPQDSVEQNLQ